MRRRRTSTSATRLRPDRHEDQHDRDRRTVEAKRSAVNSAALSCISRDPQHDEDIVRLPVAAARNVWLTCEIGGQPLFAGVTVALTSHRSAAIGTTGLPLTTS